MGFVWLSPLAHGQNRDIAINASTVLIVRVLLLLLLRYRVCNLRWHSSKHMFWRQASGRTPEKYEVFT